MTTQSPNNAAANLDSESKAARFTVPGLLLFFALVTVLPLIGSITTLSQLGLRVAFLAVFAGLFSLISIVISEFAESKIAKLIAVALKAAAATIVLEGALLALLNQYASA